MDYKTLSKIVKDILIAEGQIMTKVNYDWNKVRLREKVSMVTIQILRNIKEQTKKEN